jgi:glyoxylase-like metal-dependent hydrolase (beta-lactamase superfamily II)
MERAHRLHRDQAVEAFELAPDLWRWTGRRDTIGVDVSCVYYRTGRDVLLFDPLLPPEDPAGFWRALDRDVLPIEARVHVLVTCPQHTRSGEEMIARYDGARLWTPAEAKGADSLPAGVAALATGRVDEVVFWIPEHRALIAGDALVGDGAGGLRLGRGASAAALLPLLVLDATFVLPSHGEPPADGAAALRAALR